MAGPNDLIKEIKRYDNRLKLLQQQVASRGPRIDSSVLADLTETETTLQELKTVLALAEREDSTREKRKKAEDLPLVIVSYSHKDEKEKDDLLLHLDVLKKAGLFRLWIDDHIEAGADWEQEIKEKINQAKIAILLVSNNFLLSKFIGDQEVPQLLKQRAGEETTVFPIIAKHCHWWAFEWLRSMNVRPKNGRPIWRGQQHLVDEELYEITKEIAFIAMGQDLEEHTGQSND